MTHFGIIRERKNPPDMRVVLSPQACQKVLNSFPEAKITVEPSTVRVFKDEEYTAAGITVADSMENCDVLIGVKEVPIEALIPNKKYFFFSHTIKKQPYNRELLQAILSKKIELYDHEIITNAKGTRLVAFGRYAGIVGAYNGIRTYGLKSKKFNIAKAELLKDKDDLIRELGTIALPPIKILLTGKGRVGGGAKEILDGMNLREVGVEDYLQKTFDVPVYCQLDVLDYNKRKDGQLLPVQDFYDHPEVYESNFMRFAKVSNLYIAGHFYGDGAPYLYTREDVKDPNFKIEVVADVSCDIDGPVATTLRASTISDPIYGYDPVTEQEVPFMNTNAIAVMAVDNLPTELPRDASEGFGDTFVDHVIPAFFDGDKEGILDRARMTSNGKLTARYAYLQDYVEGKE
ncbi:NAD(P)-dependent oxidoreductase [Muriicola soli]|uniref:Saccharopine dehydrogenase [NAD(+), L-lysine-forming] n=1 Tax=Muriicola soli TaxID=2507538 RepID=A0A411EBG7_9FLAO|nr:NAD(P)-dependent oxidoreductase [Muriicola soli]QBA64790.1 alanine dehydrogenase [Muriicola soli]